MHYRDASSNNIENSTTKTCHSFFTMRKNNQKTINARLTSVFQYNSTGALMMPKGEENLLTVRIIKKTKNTRKFENFEEL